MPEWRHLPGREASDPLSSACPALANVPSVLKEGRRCLCPPGFAGAHCETQRNECAGRPCQNGGQCRAALDGFVCQCPPNFAGQLCEVRRDRPGDTRMLRERQQMWATSRVRNVKGRRNCGGVGTAAAASAVPSGRDSARPRCSISKLPACV